MVGEGGRLPPASSAALRFRRSERSNCAPRILGSLPHLNFIFVICTGLHSLHMYVPRIHDTHACEQHCSEKSPNASLACRANGTHFDRVNRRRRRNI